MRDNIASLFAIGILCLGAFVWLEHHDVAISAYVTFRECYV